MSVQGVNQHLRVFVSPAAATQPTVPADGTVLDFTGVGAGTGLPLGGVTFRTNLGLATVRDDNAYDPTKDTQVFYKDLNGKVHNIIINADDVVNSDLQRVAVAPTQQSTDLTIATATVGASYVIKLEVPEYGGMIAAKDEARFYGTYTAKTGDTTTDIATGLTASLKASCDQAPIPFVSVTSAAAVITVAGLAQPYVQARWSGKMVRFFLSLSSPDALATGEDAGATPPNPGNGNYHQVAALEEFYAGENEGYKNRYANWPTVTEPTLAATAGQLYTSDTITFKTKYGAVNEGSQRQTVMIFYQQ